MKKFYYVLTNGYDMIVSVDQDMQCRYLTQTNDFPNIMNMDHDEKEKEAKLFLEKIEDDSSWEDDCSYSDIFDNDEIEIIAEIEKQL